MKQPKAADIKLASFKPASEKYEIIIGFDFLLVESKEQQIVPVAAAFLEKLKKLLPGMDVSYSKMPTAKPEQEFEFLAEKVEKKEEKTVSFPAELRISTDKSTVAAVTP